jgi:hypothetical protein
MCHIRLHGRNDLFSSANMTRAPTIRQSKSQLKNLNIFRFTFLIPLFISSLVFTFSPSFLSSFSSSPSDRAENEPRVSVKAGSQMSFFTRARQLLPYA